MQFIESIYRRLTDRKVYCQRTGEFLGYVVRNGHRNWQRDESGKIVAV